LDPARDVLRAGSPAPAISLSATTDVPPSVDATFGVLSL
jgi:hypothetical protein